MRLAGLSLNFLQGRLLGFQFIPSQRMASGLNGYTNSIDLEDRVREVKTFAFFDIETTGLKDPKKITELSIIAIRRDIFLDRICKVKKAYEENASLADLQDAAKPRVTDRLSLCVNPGKSIELEAEKMTGLSNIELEHHGKFDQNKFFALNQFLGQLDAPVCLIAHNGNRFDFPVLKSHIDAIRKSFIPGLLCVDSMVGLQNLYRKPKIQVVAAEIQTTTITSPSFILREEVGMAVALETPAEILSAPRKIPADRLRREEKEGSPCTQLAAQLSDGLSIQAKATAPSVGNWNMTTEDMARFGLTNEPDSLDIIIAECAVGVSDEPEIAPAVVVTGPEFHTPKKPVENKVSAAATAGLPSNPTRVTRSVHFPKNPGLLTQKATSFDESLLKQPGTSIREQPQAAENVVAQARPMSPDRPKTIQSVKFTTPTAIRTKMATPNTLTKKRLFGGTKTPVVASDFAANSVEKANPCDINENETPRKNSVAIQTDDISAKLRASYKTNQGEPGAGTSSETELARKRLFSDDGDASPRKIRQTAPTKFNLRDLYYFYFGCDMVSAHEAEDDVKALIAVSLAAGSEYVDWIDRNAIDFNTVNGSGSNGNRRNFFSTK